VLETALENGVEIFDSVYCWTPGPAFETPLETTYLRGAGAGAFGMSTIPEVLACA